MPKKKRKPKRPTQLWKLYNLEGAKAERKNKNCPKCGAGVFLANHKDRLACGKCSYAEFIKR